MNHPERDYGLGKPCEPIAPPKARLLNDPNAVCPNCGCDAIHELTVVVPEPRLVGGIGTGRYLGCPACPYASPMVIIASRSHTNPDTN